MMGETFEKAGWTSQDIWRKVFSFLSLLFAVRFTIWLNMLVSLGLSIAGSFAHETFFSFFIIVLFILSILSPPRIYSIFLAFSWYTRRAFVPFCFRSSTHIHTFSLLERIKAFPFRVIILSNTYIRAHKLDDSMSIRNVIACVCIQLFWPSLESVCHEEMNSFRIFLTISMCTNGTSAFWHLHKLLSGVRLTHFMFITFLSPKPVLYSTRSLQQTSNIKIRNIPMNHFWTSTTTTAKIVWCVKRDQHELWTSITIQKVFEQKTTQYVDKLAWTLVVNKNSEKKMNTNE